MMKRLKYIGSLSALISTPFFGYLYAADNATPVPASQEAVKQTKEQVFSKENIDKISESYGHFIYKSLENPVLHLDYDSVIRGMQNGKAGKPSPMTEQEYESAIAAVQEIAFKEMAEKNLKAADEFLAKNAKEKGVVVLDEGKVQYKIEKEGTGDAISETVVPVLHYTGKYIDGAVFGSSVDSKEPITINLKHTIPGFRDGLQGMKVGEKRIIYVHPDQGYGTSGQLLPNSLLIFEIDLVRLDPAPKEEEVGDEGEDENIDDEDEEDGDFDEEDFDEEEESTIES